jgi:Fe-S cluster assembly ATP-binding protein
MINGRIARSGGKELITKIDNEGYDWLKEELKIEDEVPSRRNIVLGTCGIKEAK